MMANDPELRLIQTVLQTFELAPEGTTEHCGIDMVGQTPQRAYVNGEPVAGAGNPQVVPIGPEPEQLGQFVMRYVGPDGQPAETKVLAYATLRFYQLVD